MAYTSPGQPWTPQGTQRYQSAVVNPQTQAASVQDQAAPDRTGPDVGSTGPSIEDYQNVQGAFQQNLQASLAALQAQQRLAQSGAASQQAGIANQRAQLQHRLQTGLRDIGQDADRGVEAATGNAMQRGIYDSGIRTEMHEDIREMEGQAKGDLRQQIKFAMRDLSIRASGLRERMSAMQAQFAAQREQITGQSNLAEQQWVNQMIQQFDYDPREDLQRAGQDYVPASRQGSGGTQYR